MKKYTNHIILITTLILVSYSGLTAQSGTDLVSTAIPSELQKNADAVVRYDDTRVVMSSIDKYAMFSSYAITILKSAGQRYLEFAAPYKEGSEELSNIELSYYDAKGALLKKVKSKELEDKAASSSIELIGDRRIMTYSYAAIDYPITIKVSYKKTSKNTMSLPIWTPIPGYDLSVQSSTYLLENKSGIELRWSERNLSKYSSVKSIGKKYEMSTQKRLSKERYTPSMYEILPIVFVIPTKYNYEGELGWHTNWEEYGFNVYRQFLQDKSNLNKPFVRQELNSKIDENLPKKELVKSIYNFVQEQTRYILITLGDGGLAPLPAQKVHDVKYGDCKALSFYTKALLELYGIEANYVEVHADSDIPLDLFEDYAYPSPGNHIIINVPLNQDTIWLDCTSHDNPFNYLGSFTDDRLACEVHPEGGRLVRTPRYDINSNTQLEIAHVQLDSKGDITVDSKRESRGLFFENGISMSKMSKEDIDEYLKTSLLSGFDRLIIDEHNFTLDEDAVQFNQNYKYSASAFAEKAGSYMLLPISFTNLPIPRLSKDKNRTNEIFFPRDRSFIRKAIYAIPEGFTWKIPKDKVIEDKYGRYQCSVVQLESGEYEVTREFMQLKGRYPAEEYNEIKRFFDLIRKSEKSKFSLSNT